MKKNIYVAVIVLFIVVFNVLSFIHMDYQAQIHDLHVKMDRLDITPSILYQDYEYEKRLVPRDLQIRSLPDENAIAINTILPYSVVHVEDAATSGKSQQLWLYVSIPVYDSPMNYKGWIPEAKTLALTKYNIKKVKGDVFVKAGTMVDHGRLLDFDVRGRILEVNDPFATINISGGSVIRVNLKDVEYPQIAQKQYNDDIKVDK